MLNRFGNIEKCVLGKVGEVGNRAGWENVNNFCILQPIVTLLDA